MNTRRQKTPVQRESMRLPGGWQLPPFGVHQVLALMIVAVALWSIGLVWLALQGGQQWVGSWQQAVKVHVYVDKKQHAMLSPLQKSLAKLHGVQDVRLIGHDESLLWMQKWLGGSDLDAEGFAKHLPDSIEITLADPRSATVLLAIQDLAKKQGGSVNDDEFSLAKAWDMLETIQSLAWFATVVMALAMALIVSNTLRMILLARAEEVHLMRLMGAKEWFVRLPFVLEGLLLGAGAGLLAWLLQWPMLWATSSWQHSLGVDLSGWAMLLPMLLGGAVVGAIGALIATAHIVSPESEM